MLERIKSRSIQLLDNNDKAHDYIHAERVANLAKEIQQREGGDEFVILASSYVHDWYASEGREYHVSDEALDLMRKELLDLEIPPKLVDTIIEVVMHHEDYTDGSHLSIECQILQDADRLDALGAIGIARCFYTTACLNEPLGTPEDMHRLEEDYHIGQITSAVRHFYTKLLNLKNSMNTDYGRKLAQERHDFMLEFLDRFKLEWKGQK
jgi:uncharacterized protein